MGYLKCLAPPPFFEELLCLLLGENHVDKSCCTTLAAAQNRYYSRCSYGLFGMELILAHCFPIHFTNIMLRHTDSFWLKSWSSFVNSLKKKFWGLF